jgi:hypothetical protein
MNIQTKLLSICMQTGRLDYNEKNNPNGVQNPECVPFLLLGSPGSAKTACVQSVAKFLQESLGEEFPCETIACPQIQPEVLGGLPVPNHDHKTTNLYVYSAGKRLAAVNRGVLFLDEFSSAPDPVAAASLTVLQSGILGDFRMPSSVARGAAMNDPEKATAGRPLMAPESNRFCWIPWSLDVDEWVDYMNGGKGAISSVVVLPFNWERDYYDQAAGIVTNFIKARQQLLMKEPNPHEAGVAWPSPRSWRNATRLMAAGLSLGEQPTSSLINKAVEGCVGEAAVVEFASWLTEMDLPDPETVLAAGSKYELPKRDDRALVILDNVARVVCREHPNRVQRWNTATEIVEANEKKKDVILGPIEYLMYHKPQGAKIPKAGGLWLNFRKETATYMK